MQWDEHRARIRVGMPAEGPGERTVEPSSAARVIDLALRVGELLLASGEGSEDVEVAMVGITEAFGLQRCETNVTFTVVTLSYQPSLTDTPISLERVVRHRTVDYTSLTELHRLAADIGGLNRPSRDDQGPGRSGPGISLEEAYRRLTAIRRNKNPYPGWLVAVSLGGIAATAALLVGGGWLATLAAFGSALVGDQASRALSRFGLPPFYPLAVAAMPGTVLAIALDLAGVDVKGSAIVVGGVFTVLPGRALVAAIQDGLTGFYITASARLLEVAFLAGALVTGVGLVLKLGRVLGAGFIVDERLAPVRAEPQYALAAAGLGLCFAVQLQTPRRFLAYACVGAAFCWAASTALIQAGVSGAIATAVTAVTLGLVSSLVARRDRTSALPYVIPAIGPLLPGSAVYFAMLSLTSGHGGAGFTSLEEAVVLGLALGAGVNLGSETARVLSRITGSNEVLWRIRKRFLPD